jgi:hypothetical protein
MPTSGLRPHQKAIDAASCLMPLKVELFAAAVAGFLAAGYEPIGMIISRFPRTSWRSPRAHRLHRNFMGYTTWPAADMLGACSAIGDVRGAFAQNGAKPPLTRRSTRALDRAWLMARADDRARRHVIASDVQLPGRPPDRAGSFRSRLDVFRAGARRAERARRPRREGFLEITSWALTVTLRAACSSATSA